MSAPEAVVNEVVDALRSRGYEVVKREGERVELVVTKGGVTACVAFVGRGGGFDKLLLRPSCNSGLSVIDCSNVSRVKECIERLLQALEALSPQQ